MELIRDFKKLTKDDIAIAGGKGASLGEMTQADISVPAGFVILASAFDRFLEETDINVEIDAMWDRINIKDTENIEENSEIVRNIIFKKEFPAELRKEILSAFDRLGTSNVAVRSSATAEDSKIDAWAGQLESYLYVTKDNLLESIQKCWASLYTPRALFYRVERKLDRKQISVAVVVQKMINSEVSGVCFTVHPVTKDADQMIIEACWGLGEALVQGTITPDSYIIEKSTLNLVDINVNTQEKQIIRGGKGIKTEAVPEEMRKKQKLSEKQIKELANLCIKIESHYKDPQDIEWAFAKDKFYIVQSRPITTLSDKVQKQSVYKKVFTRDYSLPMLQVLYKGKAYNEKPWSGKRQPFLPYIVFVREDDTVKNYYDPRGMEWIKNHIKENIKLNKDFLNELEKQVNEKLKPIQPIYEAESPLSKEKLLEFIKNLEISYPWTETMWWLREMNGKLDTPSIKKLKEKTAKLSSGTDAVVRKSLMRIFPKIKDFVHVLLIEEIEAEKFPELDELKDRDKGFIFTQNTLYLNKSINDIEKKYGILLERENIDEGVNEIKGVGAYPGIVRGKVRRVMGHKQIYSIKEGEILVSPMTIPDFLPAMEKAAAFVTDEGGMTCHAAIVAREMKKPCIVGTKIATQILKNGDLIEIDANKGVVKILKKK